MGNRFVRRRGASAVAATLLALGPGHAFGAAFALQTQNASGLGHAYAGGAAVAEDVSTIYYNPAGLVRLRKTEWVASANLLCPSTKLQDGGSQAAFTQPLGGRGGDAGGCAAVPNFYVGVPFADKWSVGLGVNAPYGLETKYDADWLGRFQAIKSKVRTVNVNPVISWEPTAGLALGGGASWQKLDAELTKNVNYAVVFAQGVAGLGPLPSGAAAALIGSAAGLESFTEITGDDDGWGWNAGVLWQVTPQTRIGAAYRSPIRYKVTGSVAFTNPTAADLGPLPPSLAPIGAALVTGINAGPLAGGGVRLSLEMPETANLSIFSEINKTWDVMADVQYTGWSSIRTVEIFRDSGTPLPGALHWNFKNTWRAALGVNYHYTDQWVFRGGVAYDQTPTNGTDRTPGLPDGNRTWLAFGVHYHLSDQWQVDLAYAHEFVNGPDIDQNGGSTAAYGLVKGSYDTTVNIVGAQVKYVFK
jgi:long-chain fatty acid transport protein